MKFIFTIIILIAGIFNVSAIDDELCRKSTEGTDFWFGFLEGRWERNNGNHFIEITVTAREATTFTVAIGSDETPFGGTYSVAANNRIQIKIPSNLVEPRGSEKIENKGIHLVSGNPVNVYALNYDKNSADVAVIYPIQSLGKEHFAMCYTPDVSNDGRNSEFLIVAVEDSTKIDITPSKVTDQGNLKDSTFSIILNKGEVFQVQSENSKGASGQGDLTGSYVNSDKPVAFYSGSHGTRIPTGYCCWDHLYEQIPPVHSWGREYYTVPLKSRESDRYRIMAAADNTIIQITGLTDVTLDRGEFIETVFNYNQPKRIFSDKPILVAQYSQSRDVDNNFTGGNGDPFMIILSSVTQSKNDVTFVAYDSDVIKKYYVNIIAHRDEIYNIRFDGNGINGEFKPFSEGEYSYAQKEISSGVHRIENVNKERGFLAYVYGYGGVESYGYGVGFNLDLVLDLGENINFDGDTLLLCYGDKITLDAGPYFDTYNWSTGDSTQKITVDTEGKYSVQTTTIDGCNLEDSIFVLVSYPIVDMGVDLDKGCSPHSIELNGNDGFEKYVWQNEFNDTLSTNQFFIANKTGEYRLSAFDKYQCPARDTMKLVVFPVPNIRIEGDTLICGAKTNELSVSLTDAPDSVWNCDGSYTWTSNKPDSLTFSEKSHTSVKITVTEWGKYEIYYQLKTINDCLTSDTFKVDFHPVPTAEFEFVDNPEDECEGYVREVLYVGNATENANYFWNYGGSKVIDSLAWNNFTVSLGAFNFNPYIKLFIEENGCWSSDTTSKLLGANPDFILETGKASGCDSMTVLFMGTLNVPDSLLFEWDFGDGSPINNLQNIAHRYKNKGFYDVGLTITNLLSGCQVGFEIDSMIKVFPTPIAKISADSSFCYSDSAQISYAYNIDSSFCTWTFEGAHQLGNGNDSIWMMIDEPFGKAILTVNEFGCISQPDEITLKRKPHFDFYTEMEEGCQPYTLEVFAEPQDDFLNMEWLSDSTMNSDSNSQLYYFPNPGKFDVSLAVKSMETGCMDTLIKTDWITVHPKPVSKFDVDFPVALIENATITFTNFSENATEFLWDFGDNEASIDFDPIHTFSELGDYNNQLFVESEFGCKDTSEFIIKILPFSVFTPNAFRPDSEIPENRTFMPVGIGADETRFNLKIYNRWGQIVFDTNSPLKPWDGSHRNGNPAPMGNYVWISHFFDIQGMEHNQKGQILLIR